MRPFTLVFTYQQGGDNFVVLWKQVEGIAILFLTDYDTITSKNKSVSFFWDASQFQGSSAADFNFDENKITKEHTKRR